MPEIYQYTDYRKFLEDYFEESKKTCKAFSHQYFARKAGIKSSGFMLHVIKGQRNLTSTVLHKVAHAIGMDASQTEFFEVLVNFNQAKEQRDKDYYLEKLMEKRRLIKTVHLVDRQFEFYKEWYHSAIREIIPIAGKNATPTGIAKLLVPEISPAKVKASLKLLEELGLVRKTPDGIHEITHQYIEGDDPIHRAAIVNFQRHILDLAKESWDNCKASESAAHTLTLAMSEKLAREIRGDIEQFKKKLIEKVIAEKGAPERLYQITMNYFPLSKRKKEETQ
jgi:uncharacterized protein (TIGR02147 family)